MFKGQLFELGMVVTTREVADRIAPVIINNCLRRHATGDFGDTCKEDADENRKAIENGDRIVSVFKITIDGDEQKVFTITEWDRSVTTVLFAHEY